MERLHPGIKKSYVVGAILPAIIGGGILFFFGFIIYNLIIGAGSTYSFLGSIPYSIGFIIIVYVWTIIWSFMAFNRFGYELRKDGIYVESGVISKSYKLVPYSKIQNIDIRRGLFARIFGYSELSIQTAGYSGGYQKGDYGGMGAEAMIPAIEPQRAEQIRDWLLNSKK